MIFPSLGALLRLKEGVPLITPMGAPGEMSHPCVSNSIAVETSGLKPYVTKIPGLLGRPETLGLPSKGWGARGAHSFPNQGPLVNETKRPSPQSAAQLQAHLPPRGALHAPTPPPPTGSAPRSNSGQRPARTPFHLQAQDSLRPLAPGFSKEHLLPWRTERGGSTAAEDPSCREGRSPGVLPRGVGAGGDPDLPDAGTVSVVTRVGVW